MHTAVGGKYSSVGFEHVVVMSAHQGDQAGDSVIAVANSLIDDVTNNLFSSECFSF